MMTRYPVPGRCKTRLIPLLGAAGAARLHRHLTEHTLQVIRDLQARRPLDVVIAFTNGSGRQMQAWLGHQGLIFRRQQGADLGERLAFCSQRLFAERYRRVVVVGSDCPGLQRQILAQAFSMLRCRDVVLGPARDGGYYLLGLRHHRPELFAGIPWSTAMVMETTRRRVRASGLSLAILPQLADVDCPEDLADCQGNFTCSIKD